MTTQTMAHARDTGSMNGYANRRTDSDFARARYHSWLVKTLRLAMPLVALCIVVAFAGYAALSITFGDDFAIGGASLRDGKLVMETPEMSGYDQKGRPYDVRAGRAVQDLSTPDIIELEDIDGTLPVDETNFATVAADSGTYNTKTEQMQLRDNISILGARGMDIRMRTADIDMKAGTMTSDQPVTVKSDDTEISADSVRVEDNGKKIVFTDRVKTIVTPKDQTEEPSQ